MFTIKLDKKSAIPLFKQVFNQIKQLIEQDTLKNGDRLPSTRSLSEYLNVNRNTIYRAYEELWAGGYIESRSGSYSTVRKRQKVKLENNDLEINEQIDWDGKMSKRAINIKPLSTNTVLHTKGAKIIDFTPLSPDPYYIPKEAFRKQINEAIKNSNSSVFGYNHPAGNILLRETMATHMQLHTIHSKVSEIVITNGAQNAIELLLKLFTEPGTEIIVESPTYSAILPLFKFYGLKIIEIPMLEDGMDLELLEQKLQTESPKLIYTMPNFHNPTGITSSQIHREKLLKIAENYEIPIIEDGFVEELKYLGKNILPIKSMDKKGLVFYVGTFSKILFPGLRIGWIVANPYCIEKLSAIKHLTQISGSEINQIALARFCQHGLFEKQVKRMHRIYRKRMNLALRILRENLNNSNIKYTKPIGGYTLWIEIDHQNLDEHELIERIKNAGVLVTAGSTSYYQKPEKIYFRISIAHRNEQEIEVGLMKIIYILNHLN